MRNKTNIIIGVAMLPALLAGIIYFGANEDLPTGLNKVLVYELMLLFFISLSATLYFVNRKLDHKVDISAKPATETPPNNIQKSSFNAIFEASFDGIVVLDTQLQTLDINQNAASLLGIEKTSTSYDNLFDQMHSVDTKITVTQFIELSLAAGLAQQRLSIIISRPNGFSCHAEMSVNKTIHNGQDVIFLMIKDLSEQKESFDQVNYLAFHDPLTGQANRVQFNQQLADALSQADKNSRSVGVVLLGLDRFKHINESMGHVTGDTLLKLVAQRINNNTTRRGDHIARLGGDEFGIVYSNLADINDIGSLLQKLMDTFKEPFEIGKQSYYVNCSIGVSLYPLDHIDFEGMIRNADIALLEAKKLGGDRYQYYSAEMSTAVKERVYIENELRHAINRNQLEIYLQPQISITTEEVIAVEVLLRWHHPSLGTVAPLKFIPIAEENGLIEEIGNWVLKEACELQEKFKRENIGPIRVAVNFSPRQINNKLPSQIRKILEKTNIQPDMLEMEITESLLMQNPENAINILNEIHTLGIKISMDDFGTGFSSLSYLKRFPIDTLKIDRSFVNDVDKSDGDNSIIIAIIQMAKGLGISVVAEGVETLEQLGFFGKKGCDVFQGYYFSPPVPVEAFVYFVKRGLVTTNSHEHKPGVKSSNSLS